MPVKNYMVVDAGRDHSLRVPRPDLSVALGTPNACTQCHADRPAQWAAETVAAWYPVGRQTTRHYGTALRAGRVGAADAQQQLDRLILDRSQPAIARASALRLLAPYASPASEPAIKAALGDPDPLVRAAAPRALPGIPPPSFVYTTAPLLSDPLRAVRIAAARALAGTDLSGFPTAPQVDIDQCNERRCDYFPSAGLLGQSHNDCVLETGQGGMFAVQYLSFPPWGSYVPLHGDGGDLVGVTSDGFIRGFATSDGSKPGELYYFVGPSGGSGANGWVMGGSDAVLGGPWVEHVCKIWESFPGPSNPEGFGSLAYTRYTRQGVSVPVWFNGERPESNIYECMISEHYDGPDPATSGAFERFVLARGWGLIRWEAWAKTGVPSPHLDERAPPMAYCWPTAGATPGYQLLDARHWMNLRLEDGTARKPFRVIDAGWPRGVILPP